jgi:hypothetical protein
MVKINTRTHYEKPNTALGYLCERSELYSFKEMFKCLIAADSSVEVVGDGFAS